MLLMVLILRMVMPDHLLMGILMLRLIVILRRFLLGVLMLVVLMLVMMVEMLVEMLVVMLMKKLIQHCHLLTALYQLDQKLIQSQLI